MIKLLIGGSPCTHWSIAQKNNRETKAEGEGWELFRNYLIAKEKFKPDFFLYENNKSASQTIKDQIKKELCVWDGTLFSEDTGARYIEINSALVSAQNRQRFYVHNCGDVEQPQDRGVVLRDILERRENLSPNEKSYALTTLCTGAVQMVGEPIRIPEYGVENKARPVTACYAYKGCGEGSLISEAFPDNPNKQVRDYVAEPIRIGDIGSTSQAHRVYSCDGKTVTINAGGGGQGGKTGLYFVPYELSDEYYKGGEVGSLIVMTINGEGKYRNGGQPSQQYRVYSCEGKSQVINTLGNEKYITPTNSKNATHVYEVKNGFITIKGKQYPIKLADGFYIIRKLTPIECERLQTLPDNYTAAVSNAQRYKGLGNGWTAEVIIHILNCALKDVPKDEEIVVLSMYDGIGTGRYCLDKMGFTNVKYFAYETDKCVKQVAMSNYPDIIQMGDAFDVRNPDWTMHIEDALKGELDEIK